MLTKKEMDDLTKNLGGVPIPTVKTEAVSSDPVVQNNATPFAPAYTPVPEPMKVEQPKQTTAPTVLPLSRDGFAMDEELGAKYGNYENYIDNIVTDEYYNRVKTTAETPVYNHKVKAAGQTGPHTVYYIHSNEDEVKAAQDELGSLNTLASAAAANGMTVGQFEEYRKQQAGIDALKRQNDTAAKPVETAQDSLEQIQSEIDYLSRPNYGAGNIDLSATPRFENGDGTYSTVRSMSFYDDKTGLEILIPTVLQDESGQWYIADDQQAIDEYYRTGKYFGAFRSVDEANTYANQLHEQQEQLFSRRAELSAQYQAAYDLYDNLYNEYHDGIYNSYKAASESFLKRFEPVQYYAQKGASYAEIENVIKALDTKIANLPAGSDAYIEAKRQRDELYEGRMVFATDDELKKLYDLAEADEGKLTKEAQQAIADRTQYLLDNNLMPGENLASDEVVQKLQWGGSVPSNRTAAGEEIARRDALKTAEKIAAEAGEASKFLDLLATYAATGSIYDMEALNALGLANQYGATAGELNADILADAVKNALIKSGVGKREASNTVETLMREGNKLVTEQAVQGLKEFAGKNLANGAALTVLSFATNLVAPFGVAESIRAATNGSTYNTMDPNSSLFLGTNLTNAIREGVMEANDVKVGQVDLFDATYGIITSSVDSMLAAYTGGGLQIGLQAASQAMLESTQNGASLGEATMTGVVAGVFETLFETISIGQFKRLQEAKIAAGSIGELLSKKNIGTFALNILKSFGVNASEEFTTELANVLFDYFKGTQNSNYALMLAEKMTEIDPNTGKVYTPEQARVEVAKALAWQVAEAGITGGIQGVLMGAVAQGVAVKKIGQVREQVKLTKEQRGFISNILFGETFNAESDTFKLAQKLSQDLAAIEKLAPSEQGAAYENFFKENADNIARLDTLLAADLVNGNAPEHYTPELYKAQREAVEDGDATPPHVETPTETKVREAQTAAGMDAAEADATYRLLFNLASGNTITNSMTNGVKLNSAAFKNAVEDLTGRAITENDYSKIRKQLKSIAAEIQAENTVNLTPVDVTVQQDTELVPPTQTGAEMARSSWYDTTDANARRDAMFGDVMNRVRAAAEGQPVAPQAAPVAAENAVPTQTETPVQAQKTGGMRYFSVEEQQQTAEEKAITKEQHISEQILNAMLYNTGLKVRLVSGDMLGGAQGMYANGVIYVNADYRSKRTADGKRTGVDADSFNGIAWIVGHEMFHGADEAKGGADLSKDSELVKKAFDAMKTMAESGLLQGKYAEVATNADALKQLQDDLLKRYRTFLDRYLTSERVSEVMQANGGTISEDQYRAIQADVAAEVIRLTTGNAGRRYVNAEIAGDFVGSILGFNIGKESQGFTVPVEDRMAALIKLASTSRGLMQDAADAVQDMRDQAEDGTVEREALDELMLDIGAALYFSADRNADNGKKFSLDDIKDRTFYDQIELACTGQLQPDADMRIGNTAPLYREMGFPSGSLYMSQYKFFLCTMQRNQDDMLDKNNWKSGQLYDYVNFHAISYDTMEHLPDLLAKPAIVFSQNNRETVIVVTTDLDREGYPVIAAVKPFGEATTRYGVQVKTNFVDTVFGMRDLFHPVDGQTRSKLELAVLEDRLMYVSKEKSQLLAQRLEERFPNFFSSDGEVSGSITDYLPDVDFDTIMQKWTPVVKRFSIEDDGMYSALEREIDLLPTDKNGRLNASQVLGQLKGISGVMDEAKAVGLPELLEGRDVISKGELLSFVRDNGVVLDEDRRESGPEYWAIKDKESGAVYGSAREFSAAAMDQAASLGLRYDGYKIVGGDSLVDLKTGAIRQTYVAYATDALGSQTELMRADSVKIGTGGTRFNDVTLMGGDNYTEQLFRMPGSAYTNPAMAKHWGDTTGVLMHVRTKDFRSGNNERVLVVEEMQSDWHNEGSRRGYESKGGPVPDAPYRNSYAKYLFRRMLMRAVDEDYDMIAWTDSNSQMYRGNPYFERNDKGNIRGLQGYVNEYDRDLPNLASKYGDVETVFLPKASQFVTPKRYMDLLKQSNDLTSQMNALNETIRTGGAENTDEMVRRSDELRAMSDQLADLARQMKDIRNSGEMDVQHGVTVQGIRVTDDLMDQVWDGLPRFSAPDAGSDGMYSALEREIENLQWSKKGEMRADVLLKSLKNRAQKVRGLADEMKWADVEGALQFFGDTVKKDEFLNMMRRTGAPVLKESRRERGKTGYDTGRFVVFDGPDRYVYQDFDDAVREIMLNANTSEDDPYEPIGLEYDGYDETELLDEDGDPVINPMTGEIVFHRTIYGYDPRTDERVPIGDVSDYGSPIEFEVEYTPDETFFGEYSLVGGEDYTEHVYKLPGATYGGTAEDSHWHEPGVLLHTREQTMHTPDGKKVLFLDEVQSDWHNDAIKAKQAEKKGEEFLYGEVPEAPYGRTYTEYALKQMLLKAAKEGYDYIAWTTPDLQMDRWNPWRLDETYTIDSDHPKFLSGYQSTYGRDLPAAARRYGPTVEVPLADIDNVNWQSAEVYITGEKRYDAWQKFQEAKDRLVEIQESGNRTGEAEAWKAYNAARAEYDRLTEEFKKLDKSKNYGGGAVERVPGIEITPELRDQINNEGLPRFSVAGENAFTADLVKLEDAIRYADEDTDPEWIYRNTGWWKDETDGKWRFEIADNKALFVPSAEENRVRTDPAYAKIREAYRKQRPKYKAGKLSGAKLEQFEKLKSAYVKERGANTEAFYKNGGVLGDVLRHDDLYNAYPKFRDTKIVFKDIPDIVSKDGSVSWSNGNYDPDTNTITINKRLKDDEEYRRRNAEAKNLPDNSPNTAVLNVLLHEVQHAIQEIEGFEPGYNVKRAEEVQRRAQQNYAKVVARYIGADQGDQTRVSAAEYVERALHDILWNRKMVVPAVDPNTGEVLSGVGTNGEITVKKLNPKRIAEALNEYLRALWDNEIISGETYQALSGDDLTKLIETAVDDRYANMGHGGTKLTASELYKMTHGEQESNTTAARQELTPTQRKADRMVLPSGIRTRRASELEKIMQKKFSVDDDWQRYTTDEARQEIQSRERYRNWKHPELAYVDAASWDGVTIPKEALLADPTIAEAQRRVAAHEFTSLDEHPVGGDPGIDRDRRGLRDRLLSDENGSYTGKDENGKDSYRGPVEQGRKAYIVIGPPAAGKSSIYANRLSRDNQARIIDADTVKEWLEGYDDGYGAGYVQDESAMIADWAVDKATDAGYNVVIPRVGGKSIDALFDRLRDKGYRVELYYNELAPEASMMRAVARFAEKNRYLDLNYLDSIGDKHKQTFKRLAEKADYAEWRDSNDKTGNEPRLVWRSGDPTDVLYRTEDAGGTGSGDRLGRGTPAERVSGQPDGRTEQSDALIGDVVRRMQDERRFSIGTPTDYEDWYADKATNDRQPISKEQLNNTQDFRAKRDAVNIPYTGTRKGYVTDRGLQTVANSGITNDEMNESLKNALANGVFEHIKYTDQAALNKANKAIERVGWEKAYRDYERDVLDGKASKDITTMGIALYNNAVTNGDTYTAMDIASLMIKNASSVGSALQAVRMLNRLTPEGKMYMAVRSIENIADELRKIYGDEYQIALSDDILNAYRDALVAGDEDAAKQAWRDIQQAIADQIPNDWKHAWRLKFNNWRYLAMLGNPRTHIRNIVGNLGFMPVRLAKQGVKAAMERMALGRIGDGSSRTTAILNPLTIQDRARIKAARDDYVNVVDLIQSGGKMVSEKGQIENLRTIYPKAKFLEWLRNKNSELLDKEDTWFSRPAYAEALASFLKARGIDGADFANGNISPELLNTAREHAILEAQKATYRDTNELSAMVSKLNKVGTGKDASGLEKLAHLGIEAVLPFKKTPANILMRAVEYSPAGFAMAFKDFVKDVRSANKQTAQITADSQVILNDPNATREQKDGALRAISTAKENASLAVSGALDHLASGLTGTALMALGMMLAKMGIISGGKDKDKDQAGFDDLHGQQEYSINIGGINYTIDWLAPEALPLFTGVTLYNRILGQDGDGKISTDAIKDIVFGLAEPMLNMSMLSSVNDLISNMSFLDEESQIPELVGQIGYNYLTQYVPTLFGQIERITENRRETTFYDQSSPVGKREQFMLGKVANKIPGVWDYNQVPYLDAWGREQDSGNLLRRVVSNMVSPGYIRDLEETELDNELQRMHDLGYENMLPKRTTQSTKVDQTELTAEEYVAYATTKGQDSLNGLTTLVESRAYKDMNDEQKAKAIASIYSDAKIAAENTVREMRGEDVKATGAKAAGMDPVAYSSAKTIFDTAETPKGYNTTAAGNTPKWAKMLAVLNDKSLSSSDKLKFVNAESGKKTAFKNVSEAREYYNGEKSKDKK